MSDIALALKIEPDCVTVTWPDSDSGWLSRILGKKTVHHSFEQLSGQDQQLVYAIADLRAWADRHPDEVQIEGSRLQFSHDAAASLTSVSAAAIGLPQNIHLTLKTDVVGTIGKPDFRLHYEWLQHGQRVLPKRTGAFVQTADGSRRLPLWMKRALDLADNFDPSRPVEEHWEVLSEFRRVLEPDEKAFDDHDHDKQVAQLAMTNFLRGLEVRVANSFSIAPDANLGQFEVIPYSSRSLSEEGVDKDSVSEANAELHGEALAAFQYKLHALGARPAYQLGNNTYLVIDRSSTPVLEELARVQKSDREERKAFIQNPRAFITEAVSRHLAAQGEFAQLEPAEQQEAVESLANPGFLETREYSERVTGVIAYEKPPIEFKSGTTTWLPEVFPPPLVEKLRKMPTAQLALVRNELAAAVDKDDRSPIYIEGVPVSPSQEHVEAVDALLKSRNDSEEDAPAEEKRKSENQKKLILDTLENSEELQWRAQFQPRACGLPAEVPEAIKSDLKEHQKTSFAWAVAAWKSGLPGILNADEQGLGKTLQTITFLKWLQDAMQKNATPKAGPILVVAPTSLLRNWEQEVETHVASHQFGHLTRLYGASLAGHKHSGARGMETEDAVSKLDFEWLHEAISEGRGHRYWFLTTYTTLANYQHSLGKIPFAALVFDEIQNIKNKDTISSRAARAMNADFRIGLTGTPIENTTMDLWTILECVAPGSLGTGEEFKARYQEPDEQNMAELHDRVFRSPGGLPALGLRRLKDEVARDLPVKQRLLHPRVMPEIQHKTYDVAKVKQASGGMGAVLKMLHHIRSVSVHPGLQHQAGPDEFVKMSARLSATIDILRKVEGRGERALVFIEHREMQFRFAELAKHFFGLEKVDIINGDTPIPRRQAIVNRFQSHGDRAGFDLLVLGPKAAGTGLTLTAATHVIHLSRWWNPAVEEQCNDRVHRIGQTRPVEVHVPLAIHPKYLEHSFDCLLQSLMQRKRRMAQQALWPMGDLSSDVGNLHQEMDREEQDTSGDIIVETLKRLFERDGSPMSTKREDGAYPLQ